MSKYEIQITQILNNAGVPFEREKTFSDLRGGLYRFDFYLPKINSLIEIQGEQHYQFIPNFFKTTADFHASQERDRRKLSYCLANKIPIYCIPYWELDKIKNYNDLLKPTYLARDRWKNDTDWKNKKRTSQ